MHRCACDGAVAIGTRHQLLSLYRSIYLDCWCDVRLRQVLYGGALHHEMSASNEPELTLALQRRACIPHVHVDRYAPAHRRTPASACPYSTYTHTHTHAHAHAHTHTHVRNPHCTSDLVHTVCLCCMGMHLSDCRACACACMTVQQLLWTVRSKQILQSHVI